jgi:SulP family sulfate permease
MGIPSRILIIKMSKVPFMDATAYHSFEMLYDICEKHNTRLIILEIQEQPMNVLKKYGYTDIIGEENFCSSINEAIEKANDLCKSNEISA